MPRPSGWYYQSRQSRSCRVYAYHLSALVVPQLSQRPRWIVDYSWSLVNIKTLDLAPREAMQFGHALNILLQEILLANPKFGPIKLMKVDLSDRFYCISLIIEDIPKFLVTFPTKSGKKKLIVLPLVVPMGRKNSPPIFSVLTKTKTNLANHIIESGVKPSSHYLDKKAEAVVPDNPLEEKRQMSGLNC